MESLKKDLSDHHPKLKIMKTRVLKNIFLVKQKGVYRFQLEFIEQDIVIFDHIMDITEFMNLNKINIGNQSEDFRGRIVIPRIILNTGFCPPGQTERKKQFKIATDIKSIFPQCKYLQVFRYCPASLHHDFRGIRFNVDKTVCFSRECPPRDREYTGGDFRAIREGAAQNQYHNLIRYIMKILEIDHLRFMS